MTTVSNVTLAADGRFVVYEGQVDGESRLFLRRFDALESAPLAGTEGARWPFISPDGAWIGFFRDAKIYKVVDRRRRRARAVRRARRSGRDLGRSSAASSFRGRGCPASRLVSADGGTPVRLTTPDAGQQRDRSLVAIGACPAGSILFTIVTAGTGLNDARIGLLDPASGKYRVVVSRARAAWVPSGHIVFFRTGRYHACRSISRPVRSPANRFPSWPMRRSSIPRVTGRSRSPSRPTALSRTSQVPYVPPSRLTWIDAGGRSPRSTSRPRPFVGVKLSPDGHRAATASLEAGRLLIRVLDLERGTEETPAIDGMNWNPAWLPDGRLSYTSMRKGDFDVYVKDVARQRR